MKAFRLVQQVSLNFRNISINSHEFFEVKSSLNKEDFFNFKFLKNYNKINFKMPFYAVAKGKSTGIFNSWPECQDQINGFKGPVFKKFTTKEEAEQFINERGSNIIDKRNKQDDKPSIQSKQESDSSNSCKNEGSISPTLLRMKKEMKNMQKELSGLRDKFDEYITSKSNSSGPGVKRKNEEKSDAAAQPKKTKLIDAPSGSKNKGEFSVNEDGYLIVYTDGACHCNGKKGAQAGIGVYFGPGHPMNVSEPVKGRATNNTAEIQAATFASELSKAAGFDKVLINTDSQFMINCMTSWMTNWKKSNWIKKDGTVVINKEDLMDLDKASDGLLIKWNHVKAHSGIEGNEAADRLATEGAKRYVAQVKSD